MATLCPASSHAPPKLVTMPPLLTRRCYALIRSLPPSRSVPAVQECLVSSSSSSSSPGVGNSQINIVFLGFVMLLFYYFFSKSVTCTVYFFYFSSLMVRFFSLSHLFVHVFSSITLRYFFFTVFLICHFPITKVYVRDTPSSRRFCRRAPLPSVLSLIFFSPFLSLVTFQLEVKYSFSSFYIAHPQALYCRRYTNNTSTQPPLGNTSTVIRQRQETVVA